MINGMSTLTDVRAAHRDVDRAWGALRAYMESSDPADPDGYKRLYADLARALENLWKVISRVWQPKYPAIKEQSFIRKLVND